MKEEVKNYLYEKLDDMACKIAYNNSEFVCSTCMDILDDIYDAISSVYGLAKLSETQERVDEIMRDKED